MASSGSATGNLRNKTALKPGHSLMDWIRLGASGCDLTGVGGVQQSVSPEQLAAHCHRDDAWLAIRGRVYNVSHYMDFHPGGPEELLRGSGRDATELFNEVHPWVNYESILKKCHVGRLRRDSMGASEALLTALRNAAGPCAPQCSSSSTHESPMSMRKLPLVPPAVSHTMSPAMPPPVPPAMPPPVPPAMPPPMLHTVPPPVPHTMSPPVPPAIPPPVPPLELPQVPPTSLPENRSTAVLPTGNASVFGDERTETTRNPVSLPAGPSVITTVPASPLVPRMDWFQQRASVTLVWYVRRTYPAWPAARLHLDPMGCELTAALLVPAQPTSVPALAVSSSTTVTSAPTEAPELSSAPVRNPLEVGRVRRACRHAFQCLLPAPVEWPPKVEAMRGKLQVTFRKTIPDVWTDVSVSATSAEPDFSFSQLRVTSVEHVTHNVRLLVLHHLSRTLDVTALGHHVLVRADVEGVEVIRRYTPVPPCLHSNFLPKSWQSDSLCLMVKGYVDGALSRHITSLDVGGYLDVSEIDGDFDPHHLASISKLHLLAAGSGLTPMLSIVTWALKQSKMPCGKDCQVCLVCFNCTTADMIWEEQLALVSQESEGKLQVHHVLSQAGPDWEGLHGRVSLSLLEELLDPPTAATLSCVCGPPGFNSTVARILPQLGYSKEQIHVFEG